MKFSFLVFFHPFAGSGVHTYREALRERRSRRKIKSPGRQLPGQ